MSRQKPSTSPISIGLLLISIIIVISLVRSALDIAGSRSRLAASRKEVASLEVKKKQLQEQLQAIDENAAVDIAIRDKLNLAQPGDKVIILPEDQFAPGQLDQSPTPSPSLAPLKQWIQLILHPE